MKRMDASQQGRFISRSFRVLAVVGMALYGWRRKKDSFAFGTFPAIKRRKSPVKGQAQSFIR